MRCYLINPILRTITQEAIDVNDIAQVQKAVDAEYVDFARFNAQGDTVAVDDTGLISGRHFHFFSISTYAEGRQPLAGKGLVFGVNVRSGDSVEPRCTLEWLQANVRWYVPGRAGLLLEVKP